MVKWANFSHRFFSPSMTIRVIRLVNKDRLIFKYSLFGFCLNFTVYTINRAYWYWMMNNRPMVLRVNENRIKGYVDGCARTVVSHRSLVDAPEKTKKSLSPIPFVSSTTNCAILDSHSVTRQCLKTTAPQRNGSFFYGLYGFCKQLSVY